MCNSAHRYPEDRQVEHRAPSACPQSARDVHRKDCKWECRVAGACSSSIPPCCPESRRENHVADRKTHRGERDPRCAAQEHVMYARALPKSMPDEAARRRTHRETFQARALSDDRVAVQRARRSSSTTQKFSRVDRAVPWSMLKSGAFGVILKIARWNARSTTLAPSAQRDCPNNGDQRDPCAHLR